MEIDLLPLRGKRIAVAVSGGRDSMALLHYLHARRCAEGLFAIHCEHGIRGAASREDAAFVRAYCAERGIPLFFFEEDCRALAAREGVSLEAAARAFRYRCFDALLQEGKVDLVLTAHHALDNAETVLFRLCRGAALAGVGGIADRPGFFRPMLDVSRAEIDAYVRENAVPYREDATNADLSYTRNFLRHTILPALEARIPGAAEHIHRFSRLAAEDDRLLCELAEPLVDGASVRLHPRFPLFSRACLIVLKRLGVEADYTARHLSDLFALQSAENGKRICLPGGVTAYREYDRLSFAREEPRGEETPFRFGEIPFGTGVVVVGEGTQRFDAAALPPDAVFRTRRTGDRFRPFGGGERSLGDWFTDRKIPLRLRDTLPLLCAGHRVYAIVGYEISEELKVTEQTKSVAVMEYKGRS